MTRIPELHRMLVQGARQIEQPTIFASRLRRLVHRLRLPVAALVGLLGTTTIALAAGGVILTGAPVRPQQASTPKAGSGIPLPGRSRLLLLRAPDPAGGLPWGMRVVHTTRGDLCLQIGRIHNGQLGVLGVDGAFENDGRFHPLPANALPRDHYNGEFFSGTGNANTNCNAALPGAAVTGTHWNLAQGAGEAPIPRGPVRAGEIKRPPWSELRDVYLGMLGKDAVSVTYRDGARLRTVPVEAGTGAYMIVLPANPAIAPVKPRNAAASDWGTAPEGQNTPHGAIAYYTYRLNGHICERGHVLPRGKTSALPNPCPAVAQPTGHAPRKLHLPIHARLELTRHEVSGVRLSFIAPLAVNSATEGYRLEIPLPSCGRGETGTEQSLAYDIAKGATVTRALDAAELFRVNSCHGPKLLTGACPHDVTKGACEWMRRTGRLVTRRQATVRVIFEGIHEEETLVGTATIRLPPGYTVAPARRRR